MFCAALVSALHAKPQAGFLHTNRACVSRLPGVMDPQAEQRREVLGAGTLTTVPSRAAALYSSIVTVRPHASPAIARLSPVFCRMWVPGVSLFPRADLTMLVMVRSSTPMRENVSASSVVVLCCQSTARRVAVARSWAIWSYVRASRCEVFSPFLCVRRLRPDVFSSRRSRFVSPSDSQGPCARNVPSERARGLVMPRSMPTVGPVLCGFGRLCLDAEDDVPAVCFLYQPGAGDLVQLVGALADRQIFGPPEEHVPDLRRPYAAPSAVQPDDLKVAALGDVHSHLRAEAGLEVRGVRPAFPAVHPGAEVRLEEGLGGLRRQSGQPGKVLAGVPYRLIGRAECALVLGKHLPPVVEQIPHGAGSMPLVIGRRELGRREVEPGLVAAMTLQLSPSTSGSSLLPRWSGPRFGMPFPVGGRRMSAVFPLPRVQRPAERRRVLRQSITRASDGHAVPLVGFGAVGSFCLSR